MNNDTLIRYALDAMKNAYAPYSGCLVGAAILCSDGSVYTGCNIENASFSATCCAERTALFKAVSEGKKEFSAIAVVGGKEGKINGLFPPCGVCRQALSEFAKSNMQLILYDGEKTVIRKFFDILPLSFSGDKVK